MHHVPPAPLRRNRPRRSAIWLWWANDADGSTWGVFAGTGKYEGATGGGTWEFGELWPDGEIQNNWRGDIDLK